MDFWLFVAFFAGILATLVFFWSTDKRAKSLIAKTYQLKGVEVKQEQSVRLMAFITELKAAYDESVADGAEFNLKDFGVKKALPIVLKYPDVVAKHGTKLLKLVTGDKGNSELGGLLKGIL